jgi:hypothetical protein
LGAVAARKSEGAAAFRLLICAQMIATALAAEGWVQDLIGTVLDGGKAGDLPIRY